MTSLAASLCDDYQLKTGRHARFIYIYVPDLPISLICRRHQIDEGAPIALYEGVKGADRLIYCNQAAVSFGLHCQMSLSDARALAPLCRFFPTEHKADRQWLTLLGQWCWRYSPVVGVDPDGLGLWIDATGASHLWGGEDAMLADIAAQFKCHHLTAHIVMASYYGAALGLAITQKPQTPLLIAPTKKAHLEALTPLPLAALRLSKQHEDELAQLGMTLISDIMGLKRAMVSMRFGEEVILRRDQIMGIVPERPHPLVNLQPVLIQQHYQEPISGIASLAHMIEGLLESVSRLLSEMDLACRALSIGWQIIDGQHNHITHRLSRPSRDAQLFKRLFAETASLIDAGFGIEYGWVKASAVTPQIGKALIFNDAGNIIEDEADKLSHLVDHLAARLGAEKVQTLAMVENWIPEKSEEFVPAQHSYSHKADAIADLIQDETAYSHPLSSPRPIRLLTPPEPIQAIALLPDHPPSQIRWRHQNWRIRRATGPERIGPRWWQSDSQQDTRSRDYYRLETQTGQRLWVYRQGLPERHDDISWFLHGFFA